MTQQSRLYIFKMLLLFLLFEPIICSSYEHYNTRQDRSPFFDINPYFNMNYGDSTADRRNFEYRPYQPNYVPQSPQSQHLNNHHSHSVGYHRYRDEAFFEPRTADQQFPEYSVHQRSVPIPPVPVPAPEPVPVSPQQPNPPLPLPYQGSPKKMAEDLNLEEKIRSIFYVGPEKDLNIFNTTLDPKLSSLDRMHADESFKGGDENSTDSSSGTALSSSELVMKPTLIMLNSTSSLSPSSSSSTSLSPSTSSSSSSLSTSMNNEAQAFKVQRTADGKLTLVFNDILSLQRPVIPQTKPPPPINRRPDIIFPTTASDTAFNGCDMYEGQSLCKKVRDYPNLAKLDTLLQREFSQLGVFFTEDIEQPFNVSQRFGGDPDEVDPCSSVERTIYPQAGETLDSRWLLIVNDKNSYKQGVRVEECMGNDQPCNIIDEFLPNNYRSICKQSYVFRSLIALTENGTVTKEQFKIPSCCKCVLRSAKRF